MTAADYVLRWDMIGGWAVIRGETFLGHVKTNGLRWSAVDRDGRSSYGYQTRQEAIDKLLEQDA